MRASTRAMTSSGVEVRIRQVEARTRSVAGVAEGLR